jgi:hypothetical protein
MRRLFFSVARCPTDFFVGGRLDGGGAMGKDRGEYETLVCCCGW